MSGFQNINIRPLIDKYNLVNFIETGCYTGDGIAHALLNGIPNIYSCDINNTYVEICKQKFPGTSISHQSSIDFLNDVIQFVPGNSLIWLDAHLGYYLYGHSDASDKANLPLWDEVQALSKKDDVEKDVILIDDIRIINSEDNPTFNPTLQKEYQMRDITIKMITDLFPKHNHELLNWQEGVLFFTPK